MDDGSTSERGAPDVVREMFNVERDASGVLRGA